MMKPASAATVALALMLVSHAGIADAGTHRGHRSHSPHAHRTARVYNDSNYAAHDYSGRGAKPKSFVPRPRMKPAVQRDY